MAHNDMSSRTNLSTLTKSILFVQSVVIVALSTWLYTEYLSNQYLQTYLVKVFQGTGSLFAMLGLGGILALGLVGTLLKARNIMGEIEQLSSKIEDQTGTNPIVEALSPMPVLELVDSHPTDDIGRIHGSMRRWIERSRPRDRSA